MMQALVWSVSTIWLQGCVAIVWMQDVSPQDIVWSEWPQMGCCLFGPITRASGKLALTCCQLCHVLLVCQKCCGLCSLPLLVTCRHG